MTSAKRTSTTKRTSRKQVLKKPYKIALSGLVGAGLLTGALYTTAHKVAQPRQRAQTKRTLKPFNEWRVLNEPGFRAPDDNVAEILRGSHVLLPVGANYGTDLARLRDEQDELNRVGFRINPVNLPEYKRIVQSTQPSRWWQYG